MSTTTQDLIRANRAVKRARRRIQRLVSCGATEDALDEAEGMLITSELERAKSLVRHLERMLQQHASRRRQVVLPFVEEAA